MLPAECPNEVNAALNYFSKPLLKSCTAQTFQIYRVIGAGTMGSGIAAQIANAGYNVLLFTR